MRQAFTFACLIAAFGSNAMGADEYEQPPIEYSASTPDNDVSRLQAAIDRKEVALQREPRLGYLRDLLSQLKVSPESQILVMSKTSAQRNRISPRTPRAIYFNDDVYVGYCVNGDVIETSIADPRLGAVFYTLDHSAKEKPQLVRQTQSCLQCHGSSQTDEIPGFLMRSLYVDAGGFPILSEGGHYVDDTTPMENRWGGWYVTGKLGGQSHLGNLIIRDRDAPKPWKSDVPQDVVDLSDRILARNYLTPYSDAVALMVFAHQTYVHNLITKANFTARQAQSYQVILTSAVGNQEDEPLASVTHRIESAGEKLVQGLLFANEAPIEKPIAGNSGFAEKFVQIGPRDAQGRSLREFDLTTRLFKYPCSYLIYSRSFDELPPVMKKYVAKRLKEVLAGDGGDTYSHLTSTDRRAISEVLCETKPELWAAADSSISDATTK